MFSQADFEKGGRYLGEFRATQVDEGKRLVALQPTMKLSEREVKRLAELKGAVLMCEVMPADDHQAFAGLKPADLKAILPSKPSRNTLATARPPRPTTRRNAR